MIAFFALFARYKLLLEIIVIGALAAGAVYEVHQFLEHERDIGRAEVQVRWDAQKAADTLAVAKQEKEWREKYDAAITQGVENVQIARAAAAAANASADSLRNTTQSIAKLIPGASAETARLYAATYGAVFDQCVKEYKEMGRNAQGHADDAKTLSDAWPASNMVVNPAIPAQNIATPKR